MKIILPYPVSVNSMYTNVRGVGRVKTKKYRSWINFARADLQHQMLKTAFRKRSFEGKVDICIRFKRPDKRTRDADNPVKCLFDLLKKNGVFIKDDDQVEHYDVGWRYDGPPGVILEIWEFGGINPHSHEKGIDYAELQINRK